MPLHILLRAVSISVINDWVYIGPFRYKWNGTGYDLALSFIMDRLALLVLQKTDN